MIIIIIITDICKAPCLSHSDTPSADGPGPLLHFIYNNDDNIITNSNDNDNSNNNGDNNNNNNNNNNNDNTTNNNNNNDNTNSNDNDY